MKTYAKIFLTALAVFFVFVFVFAPVNYLLVQAGVVEYENVGNVIEVEKVYDDSHPLAGFLNAVEEGKRTIRDIYINYLPAYVETAFLTKTVKDHINSPFTRFLSEIGNRIVRQKMEERKQANQNNK
ncbi:MAG: hypothetical protein II797_00660 [Clostridia bacterium]|nr:hypothetical protein [Clostridia bacterium]